MRHALEIVFRQRRRLLFLLVLLPLLSLALSFFLPRPYQANAALWAAKRYNVTDASWAARWYDMLGVANSVPAQAQADALTELLNSRTFALQVAKATDLPSQVAGSSSDPQQRDDALFTDISRNVKVQAVGNNLVTISYTNRDSRIAKQVVAAAIADFSSTSEQLAVQAGQELLTADQTQLSGLQNSVNIAASDLDDYLKQHPGESADPHRQAADPQYLLLNSRLVTAENALSDVQSQIGQLELQIAAIGNQPDAFFTVQDQPTVKIQSRTQTLLLALAVGVAIALVLFALYVTFLMRANRTAYSAAELKAAVPVPVLAEIPAVAFTPSVRAIFVVDESKARLVVSGRE